MLKIVNDGRLFFAPIQSPRRILDVGTGSGIWPIEMGRYSRCPLPPYYHTMYSFLTLTCPMHSIPLPTSRNHRH